MPFLTFEKKKSVLKSGIPDMILEKKLLCINCDILHTKTPKIMPFLTFDKKKSVLKSGVPDKILEKKFVMYKLRHFAYKNTYNKVFCDFLQKKNLCYNRVYRIWFRKKMFKPLKQPYSLIAIFL